MRRCAASGVGRGALGRDRPATTARAALSDGWTAQAGALGAERGDTGPVRQATLAVDGRVGLVADGKVHGDRGVNAGAASSGWNVANHHRP